MSEKNKQKPVSKFDRPDERLATLCEDLPWGTADTRGGLHLAQDGSQHRRYASLFEDLLN